MQIHDDPNDPTGDGTLRLRRLDTSARKASKRLRDSHYNSSQSSQELATTEPSSHDDGQIQYITEVIRRAMVYHVCLFDDYSQDLESVNAASRHSARNACRIRTNSVYEMLCALRDCLTQLRRRCNEAMEAVLITDEYSGIFTNDEVVLTRSTVGFRNQIAADGIRMSSIYEAVASASGVEQPDRSAYHDMLVNDYLKMAPVSESQHTQTSSEMGLAIVEHPGDAPSTTAFASKEAFFKALNLPLSDDYDVNVLFSKGRSNRDKLLRFLEKQCKATLLKLSSTDLHLAPVKFVLSNFPVIFSKLQEMRVSSNELGLEARGGLNALTVKGLILPSVLNGMFKVARRMQVYGLMKDAYLSVKYNTEIDSDLHETCLQISEKSRIYHNFMANVQSLERGSQQMYRMLRRMVPFTNFVVRKGRVTVPELSALKTQGSIALSSSPSSFEPGDGAMRLADMPRSQMRSMELVPSIATAVAENVVILKDTLFTNLAAIKFTTAHLEGASTVAAVPTKMLVDGSLSRVLSADASSAAMHPKRIKCYIELYPAIDSGTPHAVWDVVHPYNLVNLVWLMGYLLHVGGYLPFLERDCSIECGTEHASDQDSVCSSLSLSRSYSDDMGLMLDRLPLDHFSVDVSPSCRDPLAQQSYIIKLVQHVCFNKRFQSLFGLTYAEHTRAKLQGIKGIQVGSLKRHDSFGSSTSEPAGTADVRPASLTKSWRTLIARARAEGVTTFRRTQTEGNIAEDLPQAIDSMSISHGDSSKVATVQREPDETSADIPGFLGMFLPITSEEVVKIPLSRSESMQSVSSSSREHGRVLHCAFDFDTKAPFKDRNERSTFQKEIEALYSQDQPQVSQSRGKNHLVFVFLTAAITSALASSRIKLAKDVINSSDLVFLQDQEPDNELPMEYNAFNAERFTRKFKSDSVATPFGEYYVKGGLSYSFVVGMSRLDGHLLRLHQMFSKDIVIDLYFICMESDFPTALPSVTAGNADPTSSPATVTLPGKQVREHYVSYAWLCDAYVHGCVDLRAGIPSFHELSVKNGELTDPFYGFGANRDQPVNAPVGSLKFAEPYRTTKFLWGWSVYVLGRGPDCLGDADVLEYKRHCGIDISCHASLDAIAHEIRRRLESNLQRFCLGEDDVATFLSHPRIYTNTVVLVGDPALRVAVSEQAPKTPACCDSCLRVTFGGKPVSFGRHEGIPLVSPSWFIDTLLNCTPEPISDYTLS
ncbi:translation initiation factor EIF-2B subunit, putative [Babesia caballi]|uniref:Translation initiation factor EIF-2B subunit, putative n=1 Tax=Babesia caballi TaxID=5871 RepID=A0AAV4LZU9_BABCB|nr:translation initiation factor EIF-2B subunit, putative [Babesia caballi]